MVISHSPFFYTTETVSLRHSWQASEKWCKNHFITRRASYIVVANVSNFKRSPTSSHGIFSFHRIKYTFCPILPSPHTSFFHHLFVLFKWIYEDDPRRLSYDGMEARRVRTPFTKDMVVYIFPSSVGFSVGDSVWVSSCYSDVCAKFEFCIFN